MTLWKTSRRTSYSVACFHVQTINPNSERWTTLFKLIPDGPGLVWRLQWKSKKKRLRTLELLFESNRTSPQIYCRRVCSDASPDRLPSRTSAAARLWVISTVSGCCWISTCRMYMNRCRAKVDLLLEYHNLMCVIWSQSGSGSSLCSLVLVLNVLTKLAVHTHTHTHTAACLFTE